MHSDYAQAFAVHANDRQSRIFSMIQYISLSRHLTPPEECMYTTGYKHTSGRLLMRVLILMVAATLH
jgi:hypothetical protein